ncbi:hypothetical protein ABW20_dc0101739 [Dactylellina cionopaga]|nr:hypothetical protein ABW20_dc0101739 [Dactylellina cionopaga]
MRSNILLLTTTGLSSLVVARYLPAVYTNQKHLIKRQMEDTRASNDNPFIPLPIKINLAPDDGEGGNAGANDGEGTPSFSNSENDSENGNGNEGQQLNIPPPVFSNTGLGSALNEIDLASLQEGPDVIISNPASQNQGGGGGLIDPKGNDLEEYPYASFIIDDFEPSWYELPTVKRNPNYGKPPQVTVARTRLRPSDQPKYDSQGRRMGLILNEAKWVKGWEVEDVHPYWGVIQPGHDIAEEPRYLNDGDNDDLPVGTYTQLLTKSRPLKAKAPLRSEAAGDDLNAQIKTIMFGGAVEPQPADNQAGSQSGSGSEGEGRDRFVTAIPPTRQQQLQIARAKIADELLSESPEKSQSVDRFVADSQGGESSPQSSNDAEFGEDYDQFLEEAFASTEDISTIPQNTPATTENIKTTMTEDVSRSLNEIPESPAGRSGLAASIDTKYVDKKISSLNDLSRQRPKLVVANDEDEEVKEDPKLKSQKTVKTQAAFNYDPNFYYSEAPMDLLQTYGGYAGTRLPKEETQGKFSKVTSLITSIPKSAGKKAANALQSVRRRRKAVNQPPTNQIASYPDTFYQSPNTIQSAKDVYNVPIITYSANTDEDEGDGKPREKWPVLLP